MSAVTYAQDWRTRPAKAAREGFGEALLAAARRDWRIVALCADVTDSVKLSAFAREFPDRFVETGVAEQNMLGMAAGLALSGKIPFAASYAAFNPGRTWDQLRVSVAYAQANVKIIGSHAGVNVGPDGATHQALEDIALTRVLPHLTVLVPTDYEETRKAVAAAIAIDGPVYIRFGREAVPQVTLPETPFSVGKATVFRRGTDVTVCANGPMVAEALLAADTLSLRGISAEVLGVHTVKPLGDDVENSARRTGAVVVAEEAQVAAGLGGAIAERLSERFPVPVVRVGMSDSFGQSGLAGELLDRYGMRAENIVQAAISAIRLKR